MADAPRPTASHRAEYYALRSVVGILHALPWNAACEFGAKLGTVGYKPLGIRRHVVERQIAAAFPELSEQEVQTWLAEPDYLRGIRLQYVMSHLACAETQQVSPLIAAGGQSVA